MAALPGPEWSSERPAEDGRTIGTFRHVFTHFALDLRVDRASEPAGDGWWQPLDRLADAGLPTLYRRAAEIALSAREAPRAAA
jgi:A/G-specific adenine glycosylase